MVLKGTLHREGRYWVIRVPDLEITTQGLTRDNAYRMIREAIELHVAKKGFTVTIRPVSNREFVIRANNTAQLIGLMLKRQRQINGLTISDVTKRLKKKTNTYYHQYECGKAAAGLDKISEFLHAMNPDMDVALNILEPGS